MNSGRLPALTFERIDGVEADVETRALRDQALDHLAVGIFRAQQLDAGTERHNLDRDLVGVVEFHQIAGDAEHEALFARVVVGELQHDPVLGKWLVLQRRLLGAGIGRGGCDQKRRDRGANDG